ncbi:putative dioxygenase C576.01c [Aspergillus lentulus]|nr:putative dioxygenase C576.01c [Aspergillus lentulus]
MTDFVQKTHRAPYEEINPRLPNLSQQRRTILITGGSSGIGFAIARAFALADADRVIILGRREAAVTEAVSSLRSELPSSFQGQISGRVCDVSDQAHIDDLWDQLARDNVDIDVVVLNAASFSQAKPVLDLGVDTLLDDYRVNVLAGYRFAQRLSRQNASKKKYLINVSTIAIHNFDMAPNNLNYGASKNAAALLLQLIARDVPPSDMQIVSFHPGAVLTETARSHGYDENTLPWDDGKHLSYSLQASSLPATP